jgi:hypothetical protein
MNSLKIRLKLNEGRIGIPVKKVSGIACEVESFLVMISEDIGLPQKEWLAINFQNGSLIFDCEQNVEEDLRKRANRILTALFNNELDSPAGRTIRYETRAQFFHIATRIDPGEVVRFGLFCEEDKDEPSDWYPLSRENVPPQREQTIATYLGEIQGVVHTFIKEGKTPQFIVQQIHNGNKVRCYFGRDLYDAAVATLSEADSIIFVEGLLSEDTVTGQIKSIDVEDFRLSPDFSPTFFESFMGSRPGLVEAIEAEFQND